MRCYAPDDRAMEELGKRLARSVGISGIITLCGELGAGKTTLVRGLLRGLGYEGKVRSPTYTLVEPYPLDDLTVYHLDLYRLGEPEELEWLGIRDLLTGDGLLLVEWPERGRGVLPPSDLEISIDYQDAGRMVRLRPLTGRGELMAGMLSGGDCSG